MDASSSDLMLIDTLIRYLYDAPLRVGVPLMQKILKRTVLYDNHLANVYFHIRAGLFNHVLQGSIRGSSCLGTPFLQKSDFADPTVSSGSIVSGRFL